MSCLEKCLFKSSAHRFLFVFLMLSCMSCLYILDINPLLVKLFANIFSHAIGCLFTLFMASLLYKSFKFIQVPFVYFCFYFFCLWGLIQEDFAIIYAEECFACVLFQEFYGFMSYIQVFKPFLFYFCMCYEGTFQFHSFTCFSSFIALQFFQHYC